MWPMGLIFFYYSLEIKCVKLIFHGFFIHVVEGKFPKPAPKRHYVGLGVMSLTPDLQMNLKKMAPNFPTNVEQGIVIGSVYVGSPAHQ